MSEIINSVWIGNELGPVHAACLRSFVRHGYDIVLHCYESPVDLPDGVRLFDAAKLMPREQIFRNKRTGSLAMAADIYRYRMQREGMGLYVDCDVYCVRPVSFRDYMFGWEMQGSINNAVLKLPQNSELLSLMLEAADDPYFIPLWYSPAKYGFQQLRKRLGLPRHVSHCRLETLGPSLLTYMVNKLELAHQAQAIDIYSPLHLGHTPLLFEPALHLNDLITPRTQLIHLYNSALKGKEIPAQCPLRDILNH